MFALLYNCNVIYLTYDIAISKVKVFSFSHSKSKVFSYLHDRVRKDLDTYIPIHLLIEKCHVGNHFTL
jgi:hypothetical protein